MYGGSIAFSSLSKRHTLEIGRNSRSNSVRGDHASAEAVEGCLLPSSKNYVMHTCQFKPRRSWRSEWASAQFSISNEIATGEDLF